MLINQLKTHQHFRGVGGEWFYVFLKKPQIEPFCSNSSMFSPLPPNAFRVKQTNLLRVYL